MRADDPHFLHAARSLQALLSPPVEQPRALCWLPGAEILLVAGRDGAVHEVEPSFGTRTRFTAAPDPAQIAVARGQVALLTREGLLQVWTLDGTLRWQAPTGLFASLQLTWWSDGIAVAGEDAQDRRVIVFDDGGARKARARVPARAALGVGADGGLLLGRSTIEGLAVRPFGQAFTAARVTDHQLRFADGGAALGIATGGATVWHPAEPGPVNVKLYDVVNIALSPDHAVVALGTRTGGVALASARAGTGTRANPSRTDGHDGPVIALAFSARGRWLASAASRCWVWSY